MATAKFPCPECAAELGRSGATKCKACGWTSRRSESGKPAGIPESCEYTDGYGERCRYPATMSPTTYGDGPWYCRVHFWDRHTSMGDIMVKASRDYAPAPRVEPTTAELESGARAVAERFGVDPNMTARERFGAVLAASGVMRKATSPHRRERVPGEDDA